MSSSEADCKSSNSNEEISSKPQAAKPTGRGAIPRHLSNRRFAAKPDNDSENYSTDNMDDNNGDDSGEDASLSDDDDSTSDDGYWSEEEDDGYAYSETLNEETLGKINLNNSEITSLKVNLTGEYVQSVNWNTEGKSIGNNTQLEKIEIICHGHEISRDIYGTLRREIIQSFCKRLATNRSIEAFCIFDSDLSCMSTFFPLQPFFIHTNLVRIDFYESDIGGENTLLLASALKKRSNKHSLEVLNLHRCDMGGEYALDELIISLERYNNLAKLYLHDCGVEGRCFVSLANILLKPDCSLEKLELGYNNVGNPQDIVVLAKALSRNTSLKCLDFGSSRVDNEEVVTLCNALAKNNTLKFLKFTNTPMSSVGLRSLSNRYQYLISSLTFLDLSCSSPLIDDEGASILGDAIIMNTTLKGLVLDGGVWEGGESIITPAGWQSFSVCLHSPNSTLTRLSIESCNLDDEKIAVIANALVNNSTLNDLGLNRNDSISVHGWQSFSACLRSPISALQRIGVYYCNLTDEIMIGFAEALTRNTCLKVLAGCFNENITDRSWDAFNSIVCNTSSIEATLDSNHTLQSVARFTTTALDSSLQLNENQDKKQDHSASFK